MNLKINPSTVLGATATGIVIVIWTLLQNFVITVWANDKKLNEHEIRFAGYDGMRAQVQEIYMRVDTLSRDMKEIKEHHRKEMK